MKISIIIVNYNVRFFLQHCLHSVVKACEQVDAEVIVVDNGSSDGSQEMMREHFPDITYVYQRENLGFSKANNMGIRQAKGEYVLLLNPDTVVQEDTFARCIRFMDDHANAGGMGVKMLDGHGKFLPESKRGLPTPSVAFYKVFGLSSIFPRSKRFGKYHLGYLDENKVHEVDVLSGAFMLMRKSVLDNIGLLDEDYFMYGEDIDLSYRIQKGGFKNYYFPETQIIHYKGESTKKGSLNYVFVFYRAMIIFARKHFKKGQASLFGALINLAIYFRALLAVLVRIFGRSWQLMIDFAAIYSIFFITTALYADIGHKDFSMPFVSYAMPIYTLILCGVLFFSGAYDQPFRYLRFLRGWLIGFLMLLAFYALLPEHYRFSRAVILFGSLGSLSLGLTWRLLARWTRPNAFRFGHRYPTRRLIIGNPASLTQLKHTLSRLGFPMEFVAGMSASTNETSPGFIGHIGQLAPACRDFNVQEVLFSASDCTYKQVLTAFEQVTSLGIELKITYPESELIIGSNSVLQPMPFENGQHIRTLNHQALHRNKRTFDLVFSTICLVLSPLLLLLIDKKGGFLSNIFRVISGKRSWVGLDPRGMTAHFPKLKQGIVHPMSHIIWPDNMEEHAFKANSKYLEHYHFFSDVQYVTRHFPQLGN